MHRLLAPRPNQKVVVTYVGEQPASVIVYGAARSYGKHDRAFKAIETRYTASSKQIKATIFEERRGVSVPLPLYFKYVPSMPYAPIHEVSKDRNKRIKEFYWKLWYGDDSTIMMPDLGIHDTFTGPECGTDLCCCWQCWRVFQDCSQRECFHTDGFRHLRGVRMADAGCQTHGRTLFRYRSRASILEKRRGASKSLKSGCRRRPPPKDSPKGTSSGSRTLRSHWSTRAAR
jgi:hypothetical protein